MEVVDYSNNGITTNNGLRNLFREFGFFSKTQTTVLIFIKDKNNNNKMTEKYMKYQMSLILF